ncbi:Pfs, NACHT and ankyrin domain protein [Lasiosphaeria miniovina]|uniref:Pfs, NACHT and ankyrin domain protein n=1 Tax=Lasiosphaeria miniovina TaxID=1954250 RepID=A0AA40AX51_9PEZI|nr:Pfs, NACHT and ankyrin domain protein [Lasiosphaeria miniovina]KAK0723571.1 Pfs, NACHT and ankyrin domain protein [Lasiosphaeria miniovina]
MKPVKRLDSPDYYMIAWIAPLPVECAAVTALLDEAHAEPHGFEQHEADPNSYTWGRMGAHDLVIASLPAAATGTVSAATTASGVLSSLPHIRIGLLVGIGGGIASPDEGGRDVRLGDVVVSLPTGATGGVVQYDLVKAKPDGERERTGFLNMPPQVLLHALGKLRAKHRRVGSRLGALLQDMCKENPFMARATELGPGFVHQGLDNDRLFNASYGHAGGPDCLGCDVREEVRREARDSTEPRIHYGIIASGDTLVKDAAERAKIVELVGKGCLCVEMEAAGLMNHFPCLVIRGISDYADSHKNDQWQPYASATAAAFGKELLEHVPSGQLRKTPRAFELLQSIEKEIKDIAPKLSAISAWDDSRRSDRHANKIRKWLWPTDPSTVHCAARRKRHEGTGNWLITSPPFVQWKSGLRRHLWYHGLAGCGKTVLASTVVDHLHDARRSDSDVCLSFFFDFREKDKQRLDDLLRSLIFQLSSQHVNAQQALDELFALCNEGTKQPATDAMTGTLRKMLQHSPRAWVVLDALDECSTRGELLDWLETLASPDLAHIQLIATSRLIGELESGLGWWFRDDCMIPIDNASVGEDIGSYVKARLRTGQLQKRWASEPAILDEIESAIRKMAGAMFRWAACQLDTLERCLDYDELETALHSLPKDLGETYSRMLDAIPENRRGKAVRILQLLTYSERPLTIQEAVDVVAIRLESATKFDPKYRLKCPGEITMFCPCLVSLVKKQFQGRERTELELAHLSVKEYLMSELPPEPFRSGLYEPDARRCITRCCLAYLSCLGSETPRTKPSPLEQYHLVVAVRARFPFARYSVRYWLNYEKPDEAKDEITTTIVHFLNNRAAFTMWRLLFEYERPLDDMANRNTLPPIHFASLQDERPDMSWRLRKLSEVDVNARGGTFGNALQAASVIGHASVVRELLKGGADVNAQGGIFGTALQAASLMGHSENVLQLLHKGADVNAQCGPFRNALQAASTMGHKEVVQLLLSQGARRSNQVDVILNFRRTREPLDRWSDILGS